MDCTICGHHHTLTARAAPARQAALPAALGTSSDAASISEAARVGDAGSRPGTGALAETGGASGYAALMGGFSGLSAASLPAIAKLAADHPPEKITHVLYHAGCRDGFGAALAAWRLLGDSATYIPMGYQAAPPQLPADARVALVDFSFPRDVLMQMKEQVADLVVLDHHKTAAENLQGLDFAVFDMDRAGAGLAHHYFHLDEPLPALTAYIEDRDLWKFELPDSKLVDFGLSSQPFDFQTWDALTVDDLKEQGKTIQRMLDREIERDLAKVQIGDIAGHKVPVVSSSVDPAELAGPVLEKYPDAPFMGSYYDGHDGRRKWSLRSRGEFDVSSVAKLFGGGGHPGAAGFKESVVRPVVATPPAAKQP